MMKNLTDILSTSKQVQLKNTVQNSTSIIKVSVKKNLNYDFKTTWVTKNKVA